MRAHLCGALALALTGTLLTAGHSGAHANSRGGECKVRTMAWPEEADNGRVMDIEVVPGLGVVYYGSYDIPDPVLGTTQRTVIWYGLDAQPVQVGPTGTVSDMGFELTPSGMVNGQSVVDEAGRERAWVQSLRSGKLTWVDTPEDAAGIYVRRINDRGEAAGTVFGEGFSAEATAWWPRVDRPGRVLYGGEVGFAEAWDITNKRDVVGSIAHETSDGYVVPMGVVWSRKGKVEKLASNPGVEADTYPRLLNEAGQAAGAAWYGDFFEGHGEAARWPAPDTIEALGLLPGGGFSGVFGQSEEGWVVGVADHFDPESPGAEPWGAVDHSVLWADDPGMVRALPSPYAVANGQEDWREWFGGAAHGVHTELDQVGTMAHESWSEDGSLRYAPTVYLNASQCGTLVPTTHTAFWEQGGDEVYEAAMVEPALQGPSTDTAARALGPTPGDPAKLAPGRSASYTRDGLRDTVTGKVTGGQ